MNKIVCGLLACMLIALPNCSKTQKYTPPPRVVHESALPEGWYPKDAEILKKDIEQYLTFAHHFFSVPLKSTDVRALIVPHAGMYFSGLCAASSYQSLLEADEKQSYEQRKNKTISRVVILAPTHGTFYNGIALPDYTVYQTVFGEIPVDTQAVEKLKKCHLCREYGEAHDKEHSLDIQLPFLQSVIKDFSIVPLVVGFIPPEDVGTLVEHLQRIIDDTTLVVVSSDFIHHGKMYEYEVFDKHITANIRMLDSFAVQTITHQSLEAFENLLEQTNANICGREAIKLLLALMQTPVLADTNVHLGCYYTSAHIQLARNDQWNMRWLFDEVPDRLAQSCVSYAGLVVAKKQHDNVLMIPLTGYEERALVHMARATIENVFKEQQDKLTERLASPLVSLGLMQRAGAFVTLNTKNGQLRGCIGRIVSDEPLFQTVVDMSLAAAFNDSRFKPIEVEELDKVLFDVTVLTPPHTVNSYKDIVIGKHGVVLNKKDKSGAVYASAVFLPQVPRDYHWDLQTTLEQLSLKAGLGHDDWKKDCSFEVFEGIELHEG